jgi:hypothetical protein
MFAPICGIPPKDPIDQAYAAGFFDLPIVWSGRGLPGDIAAPGESFDEQIVPAQHCRQFGGTPVVPGQPLLHILGSGVPGFGHPVQSVPNT